MYRVFQNGMIPIRASEIGQYSFCSTAWYLQRCGIKPESSSLLRGIKEHELLGVQFTEIKKKERNVHLLRRCAILICIIALIISVIEVSLSIF